MLMLVQIKTLHTPATSGKAPAEVTQIAVGRQDSHQIAVGHADGTVSIASALCPSAGQHMLQNSFASLADSLVELGKWCV